MIYQWTIPENYKNRNVGDYDRTVSPNRFLLTDGRKFSSNEFDTVPVVNFIVPKERVLKFDCLPNNALVPLVNNRVKTLLETIAPNDIEFFKAKLVCKDGELDNYYFVNAIHKFTGIDHEKSVYGKIKVDGTEFISGFKYLTYIEGCMGDYEIARDKEYLPILLVSERVKLEFDKEKITGVWLVRPEEYYRPLSELL